MEKSKEIIEDEDFQKVEEVEKPKPTYEELELALEESKKAVSLASQTIKKQIEEVSETNNKYLRALADYQNLKRISDSTIASSKNAGKISVFKDLIPIIDDFEKAKEAGELTEGVEFIYNKIVNMLKSNGVDTINPQEGDKFDDSVHEAIVAIPGGEDSKNTVKFTQFKGYKLGDTILRYAKVGVNV